MCTCVHVIDSLDITHKHLMAGGLVGEVRKGLWRVPLVFVYEAKVVVVLAVGPSDVRLNCAQGAVGSVS